MNFYNLSATSDGSRLVLVESTSQAQIYIGALSAGGTRLKTEPHRLTQGQASYWPTGWTSDSQAVLFFSDLNGSWDIYKQSLKKEDPELLVSGQAYKHDPRLSPDGKWVLYSAPETENITSQVQVLRIPSSGGAPQVVGSGKGWSQFRCARAPAGCVWGESSSDQKRFVFFEFDPLIGKGRELASTADRYPNFDVSPDGSLVAWPLTGSIRFLSLKNGKTWDVKYSGSWVLSTFDWAADGKGMFAGAQVERGSTLLHIDLQGNAHPLWKTPYPGTWAAPSPDGRFLAILGGTRDLNVWMLENF